MPNIIPWTEIVQFSNIKKYATAYPTILNDNNTVSYRGKIKLHGSCCAVQCHADGTIVTQSRTAILTPENDYVSFAKMVRTNEKDWQLKNDMIIFGEICGPGVQSGVAISEIPKKIFAVFATRPMADDNNDLIMEPEELQKLVGHIPDVYVLPWHTEELKIEWLASDEVLTKSVALINELVMEVERNDPWVDKTFGVKGVGEGLVFYPTSKEHLGRDNFNNFIFKAKGEKHRVIKTATPVQINPEVAGSIDQFVEMVLTPARLEQGANQVSSTSVFEAKPFDMKLIGRFLNWIVTDVNKECSDELEASNLTWKQVQKPLADKARQFYIEKSKV